MPHRSPALAVLRGVGLLLPAVGWGGEIPVPNGSFESPVTTFVSTPVDGWQKTAKPPDYVEQGGFLWEQLVGIFKNTPPGRFDHIANCDGAQALFIFAVPGAGVYQDTLAAPAAGGGEEVPVYQPGHGYRLSAGLIGGGGGMAPGATLELALTWRDEGGNPGVVAAVTVTNDLAVFTTITNLVSFGVDAPPVQASDPWAGRPIGLRLLATQDPGGRGGYWDVDAVRLEELVPLRLTDVAVADGRIRFRVGGGKGPRFDILATSEPALPADQWVWRGTVTNDTGAAWFEESLAAAGGVFYRARELP